MFAFHWFNLGEQNECMRNESALMYFQNGWNESSRFVILQLMSIDDENIRTNADDDDVLLQS